MRWVYDGLTNNDFRLYRHNNSASGTEVIRFNRANNNIYAPGSLRVNGVGIGIGNSTPQNTLHVDATTSSNVAARFNTDSTYTFIDLYNDDSNRVQIGNADDGDFIIRTNDAIRMQISSSGFVGIGENNPEANLHVRNAGAGSITTSNSQLLVENNTTARFTLLVPNNNAGKIEFGDPQNQDEGIIEYNHSTNYMQFTTSGSEAMRIDDSQNVGIGTSSPAASLEIESQGNARTLKLEAVDNGSSPAYTVSILMEGYEGRGNGIFHTDEDFAGEWFVGNPYTANNVSWQVGYDASGGQAEYKAQAKLYIDGTNSRVGIGTSSPESKLNIVDSGETIIKLYASTASTRSGIWFTNGSYSYGTNIGTDNKFHITGNINSEGELVTVDSSGVVGIGVTSPTFSFGTRGIEIQSSGQNPALRLDRSDSIFEITARGADTLVYSMSNLPVRFGQNGGERFRLTSTGVVINEDGASRDFRVEGDTDQNLLFVDGSTDYVGIGTNAPYEKLYVQCEDATSPGIVSNPSQTNGAIAYAIGYGDANKDYINTWGMAYSSAANVWGYGVKPSTTTDESFINSADNANFTRGALFMDNELKFFNAGAQTGTIDTAITMTQRFMIDDDGRVGINGTPEGNGILDIKMNGDSQYVKIERNSSSGRAQIQLANESGGELWRFGLTGGGSEDFTIWDGDTNHLVFDRSANTAQFGGNVGVKTDPTSTLHIEDAGTRAMFTIQTTNNSNDRGIGFLNSGGSYNALIYVSDAGSNQAHIDFAVGTVSGTLSSHSPKMRLNNNQDLEVTGDVVAFASISSDERLKQNIITIDNSLDLVSQLRGVRFDWTKGKRKGQHDIGVIAQEVEKVIPEIVKEKEMGLLDGNTYKTVDYDKLSVVLIEAVKELKTIVEEQQKEINELKNKS